MPFYYLTENKTSDVFHNSGPSASLKLKNTWEEALISEYLLKVTLLHIFFCVSILIGLYTRGLYLGDLYLELYGITREIFFFKNLEENEAGRLVPNLFLFFEKVLCKVKASGQHLSFNTFWLSLTLTYNKSKLYTISECFSRDMPNFDFLWKSLRLASPPYFVNAFSKKYFSCYILLTDRLNCMFVFTSWDIGQYVCYNYLFPSMWRHKFWN